MPATPAEEAEWSACSAAPFDASCSVVSVSLHSRNDKIIDFKGHYGR